MFCGIIGICKAWGMVQNYICHKMLIGNIIDKNKLCMPAFDLFLVIAIKLIAIKHYYIADCDIRQEVILI